MNPQANKAVDVDQPFQAPETDRLAVVGTPMDSERLEGRAAERLGIVEYQHRNLRAACAQLELAASLIPLTVDGVFALAGCYAATGRRTLAVNWHLTLLSSRRVQPAQLLDSARIVDGWGDPRAAVCLCRDAVRRDLDFAQGFFELSWFLARSGCPLSIIEAQARRAIHLAPDHCGYRTSLASLLWRHQRHDQAAELIAVLTPQALRSIRCGCCLQRILEIVNYHGNESQIEACHETLKTLPPDAFRDC